MNGATPLHFAAYKGKEATVRMLLDYGADLRAKDKVENVLLRVGRSVGAETMLLLVS